MDFNIDLDKLLEEVKAIPEDDPRRVTARKIIEQRKNAKPETEEEIKEWAEDLSKKLSTLTD